MNTHLGEQGSRRLTVAEGYIELGMFLDANAELEDMDPEQRDRSDVLALRAKIYSGLKNWELMRTVVRILALRDPDNIHWSVQWAYATRRAQSVEAALLILLEAVERIPTAAILHYNLACYECLVGDVAVAKARLKHAIKLDPRYREKALEDEDLRAVWDSLD
jgi:hypothetical protein